MKTLWLPMETAPKDGTHILVARGPYSKHWTFAQAPPTVAHWFDDPEEPGFYTSVNEYAGEHPLKGLTHWMNLPDEPFKFQSSPPPRKRLAAAEREKDWQVIIAAIPAGLS